ncbi:unnamed protein product [Kluyveromyces dobzhanskii CBS 2104]|uniref:WGS project CCBQ000000000 data, contig 00058 n=1 Tax=Kluyveromyces dobzhanskii CBS 2104 TaxID=1427455 RepID=A0A0A8LDV4_9SACH|nr:unnamed protein product [Kluyveromyces dobzhanskii CBS 2104]
MSDHTTPKVILPRDQTGENGPNVADANDANYNLTVDHALRYQNLLANRSGSNQANGPLMTKRLRQKKDAELARTRVGEGLDYLFIRARLPDRTALDYQLIVSSTLHSLYETVKGSLVETAASKVSISLSSPYVKLNDDDTVSLLEAGFSKKTMVLVEIAECSPPYLKPHILETAKTLTQYNKEHELQEGESTEAEQKPVKKLTKTPKWLKISKKISATIIG